MPMYDEGRQLIYQSDSKNKSLAIPDLNVRRTQALSGYGIPMADQERTLLQLHEKFALRTEDILMIFFTNMQED